MEPAFEPQLFYQPSKHHAGGTHTPLDPQLLVDPSLLMLLLESFNGKMSLSLVTQQA